MKRMDDKSTESIYTVYRERESVTCGVRAKKCIMEWLRLSNTTP